MTPDQVIFFEIEQNMIKLSQWIRINQHDIPSGTAEYLRCYMFTLARLTTVYMANTYTHHRPRIFGHDRSA